MVLRQETTSCRNGHPYIIGSYRVNCRNERVCKACAKVAQVRYLATRPKAELLDRRKIYQATWTAKHPERVRECRKKYRRKWNALAWKEGRLRRGYTAGVIKSVGREAIGKALEAVRSEGRILAGDAIVGPDRWAAIRFFNKAIGKRAEKLARSSPRQRIVSAPAISFSRDGSAADLMAFVNRLVPPTLQRDMRDDVVSEIILALMEGRVTKRDAPVAVKSFISKRFASYHNKWGDLSIDELRGGSDDEGTSFLDLIPDSQRMWA